MVGCLDTRVHVHACSCACWAACLTCWWPYSRRKPPCWSGKNKGQFSAPPPNPLLPPLLVLMPQGCGRNTVSRRGLWALFGRKSLAELWREEFCSWPCFTIPIPCASRACCCLLGPEQKTGLRSLQWAGWGGGAALDLPATLFSHWGTLVPKVFPVSGTFCTQT